VRPTPQLITRRQDVVDLVTDMMDAAVRVLLDELRDRRGVAQGLDELDLGVRQGHEHGDDAVLRKRHRLRHFCAAGAINLRRLQRVRHRDGDMVQASDHRQLRFST
jgi:hypothetical protein